jgi:hypothetical protein
MATIRKSDGSVHEVPDEDVWGPPPTAEQITMQRVAQVKTECKRRIFAVADEIAQINLAAAAGAGLFTPGEILIYRKGLQWVENMRENCVPLAYDHEAEITADASWPAVPDGVAELAAQY